MTITQQPTLFKLDILAAVECHYESLIRAVLTQFLEQVTTMNEPIRRPEEDFPFKLSSFFLYSKVVPSKSTASRVLTILSENIMLLERA
ncbi:hypothetical protein IGI37_000774 [Enterococcus sp. AZ194]|uniref:hypothetical protein n=1 Tax=Enterococcus sp. AZ194 TaxID=2774629 RepID=UPI003F1FA53F